MANMARTPNNIGVQAGDDDVATYVATRPTVAAAATPAAARAAWRTFCAGLSDVQTAALCRQFFTNLPDFVALPPAS